MVWLQLLLQAEQLLYVAFVHMCHRAEVREVALLLFGLFGQDVALESVFTFDFSCSGKGEPLFGTGISFHLGHFCYFM